jgi:hypothetical protein
MKVSKMTRDIQFNDWFGGKTKYTCGIEIELMLFDSRNKEPLQRGDLQEKILLNIQGIKGCENIWKDFYPWQLELRTKPSDNPDEIIRETKNLYNICTKEFSKHKIFVIPVPMLSNGQQAYCGMHMHIGYPNIGETDEYYKKAMGMYPFALALTDHSKNCELSMYHNSERLDKSRHIGFPYLDKEDFLRGNQGEGRKYKDIILSLPVERPENKSRLVKPYTIEVRSFDTPSLFSFYEFMVRYMCSIASRIRSDNPIVKGLDSNIGGISNKLNMTRDLMINQRYGVNKIFNMLNVDVCQNVSDYFGFTLPRQTQFEYREDMGLSANVNGYLTMAIKGGWL